ncbi:hypothetical protein AH051_25375, partial [Salmonella enterica subsp. enterica]|nr:hypothetical protein [Salmonella enterica subsp. enterica]
DAGIVKDTLACTTNGSGECTSTVKTTKAGTYNVWTALVPAGAAQPVSPVKTALVFLAGPPDATNTTVSTDKSAANADNKETITVTLTPRDSHNNVVPLWTFRKDLTIVPSVNATVPGAVTVTTPAQDAAGAVTATLTYVDTSGQLLSKAARTGSTTVSIGSTVKKTFDTRFYPQVNVCLTNLDSHGFVTPGTTEVHICDGSGHPIPSGSGYKVAAPALSTSGCPADGGGVCPSDTAGVKADFTNLTGDDIRALASARITFQVHDKYAAKDSTSTFTTGEIAFYGELKQHKPATNLGATHDLFFTDEAQTYCGSVVRRVPDFSSGDAISAYAAKSVLAGTGAGGGASGDPDMKSIHIGGIASVIHTGGDTNPEIFVTGLGGGTESQSGYDSGTEFYRPADGSGPYTRGAWFPSALVFVNGGRHAAIQWNIIGDGVDFQDGYHQLLEVSIGLKLHTATNWNLSDAYFVNNWPGTPYTNHKGNGDTTYHYVTQVNYITGYICAASLH